MARVAPSGTPTSSRRAPLSLLILSALVLNACARHTDFEELAPPSTATANEEGAEAADVRPASEVDQSVPDPCTLLAAVEMQEAIGGPVVGPPDRQALPILVGMEMCQFTLGVMESTDNTVTIGVWKPSSEGSGDDQATAAKIFERYRARNDRFGLADVGDVGDKAVWDEELGILLVRSDDRILGLTVFFAEPPAVGLQEVAVQLARLALARLSSSS
jgi:hypothetical protein